MDELIQVITECLNETLVRMIISGPKKAEAAGKVTVRPLLQKGMLLFQETEYRGKQVFHTNEPADRMCQRLIGRMEEEYKQMEIDCTEIHITVLVSKKGKVTIKRRKQCMKQSEDALFHNRKKKYLIEEGHPVDFLVELGVMTPTGAVVKSRYDKFRQINRFLECIQDVIGELPKDRELTILDFGCGKSYLTFAMYHYLHVLEKREVRIIGLDLKEDVIRDCSTLAKRYSYDKLTFLQGDIADYEGVDQVDMVVTLHACDTATDYALFKAVAWNAKVILSVPCCQHQLFGQMDAPLLAPVLQYGIIKERMAALFTDGMRGELLRQQGYRVQLLEFIEMEHTPKNILIRAVKENPIAGKKTVGQEKTKEYEDLREFLGTAPLLEELLKQGEENNGEKKDT